MSPEEEKDQDMYQIHTHSDAKQSKRDETVDLCHRVSDIMSQSNVTVIKANTAMGSSYEDNNEENVDLSSVDNDNILKASFADVNDENNIDIVVESVDVENDNILNRLVIREMLPKLKHRRARRHENLFLNLIPFVTPYNCKMKCVDRVSETRRNEIHVAFWEMETRDERIAWIHGRIQVTEVNSHKVKAAASIVEKNRKVSRIYRFRVNSKDEKVCQSFFLRTLGYKYDIALTKMFKPMTPSKIKPVLDKRGKHTPKNALSSSTLDFIDGHIDSFNPSVSHYCRAHTPLRLYLPPNKE